VIATGSDKTEDADWWRIAGLLTTVVQGRIVFRRSVWPGKRWFITVDSAIYKATGREYRPPDSLGHRGSRGMLTACWNRNSHRYRPFGHAVRCSSRRTISVMRWRKLTMMPANSELTEDWSWPVLWRVLRAIFCSPNVCPNPR